jgi:hypothetical protein
MEKGNPQQSNNNLKIYKKLFTHLTYIRNVSNTFSWKRLINFIPIYSSPQYVYAFFLNRSVPLGKCSPFVDFGTGIQRGKLKVDLSTYGTNFPNH